MYTTNMLSLILSVFLLAWVIAVPTRKTEFVLFENIKTWNEALCVCRSLDMNFFSVNTPEKSKLFKATMDAAQISYTEFWLGLYNSGKNASSNKYVYSWTDAGPLGSWSSWATGEPNFEDKDKCIRLTTAGWRTMMCDKVYQFVCEKTLGPCTMEVQLYTSTQVPELIKPVQTENECLEYCLNDTNIGCFGVIFTAPESCAVYTSTDNHDYIHGQAGPLPASSVFHRKVCFEGFIDKGQYFYNDDSLDPQLSCGTVSQEISSTIPASASQSASTSSSASTSTSSLMPSSLSSLSSSSIISLTSFSSSQSTPSSSSIASLTSMSPRQSTSTSMPSVSSSTPSSSSIASLTSISPTQSTSTSLPSVSSSLLPSSPISSSQPMPSTQPLSQSPTSSSFSWKTSSIFIFSSPSWALSSSAPLASVSSVFSRIYPESSILCGCKCQPSPIQVEKQKEEIAKVVQELKVVKNATSKFRRKLISIEDDRPSANALGAVGVIMFSVVGAFVILPDLISIVTYIWSYRRRDTN